MEYLQHLIAIAVLILAAGCGSSNGSGGKSGTSSDTTPPKPANYKVSGTSQKGPLITGSKVLISAYNANAKVTDSTIVSQTDDNIGRFSFEAAEAGPVLITAEGYYRSELTGQLSTGDIVLRAVYEITEDEQQDAHVNMLTHITQKRIVHLVKSGSSFTKAITQAQRELVAELAIVFPKEIMADFTDLSLYDAQSSDESGYLLAISTTLEQFAVNLAGSNPARTQAELSLKLNELASDFEKDGSLDSDILFTGLKTATGDL